ncbi:MAG: hypothetical protein B6I36_08395 [Desulfobacteraceae bacterium 4572_35.1]|nr:MAG: hypothetical protein B6I36_08395 [Desulfobacteraceae bacterium 4572_35.1]
MRCKFARNTYKRWMKDNRSRFKYDPYTIKLPKTYKNKYHYFVLRFAGIVDEVVCLMRDEGAEIWVVNRALNFNDDDYFWDILMEFELIPKKTDDGLYYCELCSFYHDQEGVTDSTYYLTLEALWEDHVLEELLRWVNSLNHKTWIGFYENGADLRNEPEAEVEAKTRKNYHTCIPVVKNMRDSA